MGDVSTTTTVQVTVRFFAAARAAANSEVETLGVAPQTTVADLVEQLGARSDELARVLSRCSFLVDGIAVRDAAVDLDPGQTVDVLPPFAGG